jgi:small-conductance mechanosensitive channel
MLQTLPQPGTAAERLFEFAITFALPLAVLFIGLVVGYAAGRFTRRFLGWAGVPGAVEGTPFERTANRIGTSTVGLVSVVVTLFVYVVTMGVVLQLAGVLGQPSYVPLVTSYLPQVFVAVLVLITGIILGDKAELMMSERLENVRLSRVSPLPAVVKYSVFYVAGLVALSQLGVATTALVVLLAAYAFAIVFLGGIAFKDLLASGGAGIYLLLTQPYSIGDRIEVEGRRGIVQEIEVFVTYIESEGEEYIVPNRRVVRNGVVRVRE